MRYKRKMTKDIVCESYEGNKNVLICVYKIGVPHDRLVEMKIEKTKDCTNKSV